MNAFSPRELQAFANEIYQGARLTIVPYAYTVTFTALAAGATSTQQLAITANADFILASLAHHASIAAAAQTVSTKTAPCVRVMITDTGSNEQWFNTAADLENISTNGSDARMLPFFRWVGGRTSLSITATSYAAAESTTFDLLLNGALVRAYDPATGVAVTRRQ